MVKGDFGFLLKSGLIGIVLLALTWLTWEIDTGLIADHQLGVTYSADMLVQNRLHWRLSDAYKKRGRCFTTLEEFERSAYYPFNESLSPTCHNGKLAVSMRQGDQEPYLYIQLLDLPVIRTEGTEYNLNSKLPLDLNPIQITRLRLRNYARGVTAQKTGIQEISDSFMALQYSAAHHHCRTFTTRPFPAAPFSQDYPRNPQELKAYIQWLKKIEGLNELNDGWGRPFQYSLQAKRLTFRSLGTDGLPNTPDDLVIKSLPL